MFDSRNRYFAAEVACHVFLDHAGGVAHAEKEHQLGDGCLAGHVVAADDASRRDGVAGLVERAVDAAVDALGDVDDDDAAVHRLAYALDEPGVAGAVAGAVGLEDDTLDAGGVEQVVERLLGHAGIEFEEHDVVVHVGAHLEGARRHRAQGVGVVLDVEADLGELGIVEALEGVEVVGAHLGGAVATPQVVLEEDGDFLDAGATLLIDGGGDLEGGDKVFLAVGAHLTDGQLRTGDDDGFAQVLKHETQRRGGERHGVGAVQHDEAVVAVIALLDGEGDFAPVRGIHVGAVDGRVELDVVDEVREVEGLQGVRLGVLNHADSAAGVDDEYLGEFRHSDGVWKVIVA